MTARNSSNISNSSTNIHIIVDNSNLFIGSQLAQGKNGEQDASVRINVPNLVKIIEDEKEKNIKTRIVGGSKPPRKARVWTEWKNCDYECLLGFRTMEYKEDMLDDMLHAQIQKVILNNLHVKDVKQHLILITGDGNANSNRTTFPEVVSTALINGWTVDIWSWKASLSANFFKIQKEYPSQIKINYLDKFRSKITFKEKQHPQQHEQRPKEQEQQNAWQERQNQDTTINQEKEDTTSTTILTSAIISGASPEYDPYKHLHQSQRSTNGDSIPSKSSTSNNTVNNKQKSFQIQSSVPIVDAQQQQAPPPPPPPPPPPLKINWPPLLMQSNTLPELTSHPTPSSTFNALFDDFVGQRIRGAVDPQIDHMDKSGNNNMNNCFIAGRSDVNSYCSPVIDAQQQQAPPPPPPPLKINWPHLLMQSNTLPELTSHPTPSSTFNALFDDFVGKRIRGAVDPQIDLMDKSGNNNMNNCFIAGRSNVNSYCSPVSNDRIRSIAGRYGINDTLAQRLNILQQFEIVVLCDDSGSMNTPVDETTGSRWDELRSIVQIVIEIGTVFDSNGIDVHFLNRSPMFNIADPRIVLIPFRECPSGLTPLTPALKRIFQSAASKRGNNKSLLVFVATDGAPTNDYGQVDIQSLENLMRNERQANTTYVTFLTCTDDDQAVAYLSQWGRTMFNVNVIHDYKSEREEIRRTRGYNYPFSFGDYVAKALLGAVDPQIKIL